MTYGDMLWDNVLVTPLGNVYLAGLALIGIFLFLCASRGYDVDKTIITTMPVIIGLTQDNVFPLWIKGGFYILIAGIIFTAFTRRFING